MSTDKTNNVQKLASCKCQERRAKNTQPGQGLRESQHSGPPAVSPESSRATPRRSHHQWVPGERYKGWREHTGHRAGPPECSAHTRRTQDSPTRNGLPRRLGQRGTQCPQTGRGGDRGHSAGVARRVTPVHHGRSAVRHGTSRAAITATAAVPAAAAGRGHLGSRPPRLRQAAVSAGVSSRPSAAAARREAHAIRRCLVCAATGTTPG